ncbi:MAG: hypothetical protein B7733_00435 [Myxococcales bacterium FL481]|nr:MAG: hypothetical protein B7733_00435 [Myxococcales bacterium FL481]
MVDFNRPLLMQTSRHVLIFASFAVVVAGCAKKTPAETTSPGATPPADGTAEQPPAPSRARTVTGAKGVGQRVKGQLRLSSDQPPRPDDEDLPPASGDGTLVVEGFAPNAAAPGTMVEVFGRGFSPDVAKNEVTVAGKAWSVVKVGADRLLAIVPNGASDGPITIAVGSAKVGSSATFRAMPSDGAFSGGAATRNGLLGDVWAAGGEVVEMPDFAQLGPPHSTFALETVDVAPQSGAAGVLGPQAPVDNNFAVRLSGSLNVIAEAEYEFCLNSSDGSRLSLEGTMVVDNPGVHAPAQVCEIAYLESGEYDLLVEYFHGAGNELALQLLWGKDGAAPTVIPSDVLFRPERHPNATAVARRPERPAAGRSKPLVAAVPR